MGIGKELGKYVVATMEIPWNIIKNDMGKSPEKVINVTSVEKQWIEDQIKELAEFDTIVGIGGGMAIDVAKYISWKLNKKLVSIPTIISVDAFTTPAAGVRVNHEVDYLGIASTNPLNVVVIVGTPIFTFPESAITITSASNASLFCSMKSDIVGDPISSSPSIKILIFTGKSF